MNLCGSTVKSATRTNLTPTNIVYLPYNGYFEWMLSSLQFNFYAGLGFLEKEWKCGDWPQNINFAKDGKIKVSNHINIDCVMVNHKKTQVQTGKQLGSLVHRPMIVMEHELPAKRSNKYARKIVNDNIPKNSVVVYPEEIFEEEWCYENEERQLIRYGFFAPELQEKTKDIMVVGDFHPSNYGILKSLMSCGSDVLGVGFNNGMTMVYETYQDLIDTMLTSKVCISLVSDENYPFLAMMAAGCGCIPIINKTPLTELLFKDQETAILYDPQNITKLKKEIRVILGNHEELERISTNSHNLIKEKYKIGDFLQNWTSLINNVSERTYIR